MLLVRVGVVASREVLYVGWVVYVSFVYGMHCCLDFSFLLLLVCQRVHSSLFPCRTPHSFEYSAFRGFRGSSTSSFGISAAANNNTSSSVGLLLFQYRGCPHLAIPGVSSHHSPVVLPSQAFGMPGPPAAPGLSLSLSAEPIPARLVQKIQSGQFVEMRELLGDNIALMQHFESSAGYFPIIFSSPSPPRGIDSSLVDLLFFDLLGCISLIRDRLVYTRSLVRESLRHGGRGWLDYDRLFRQQAAPDHSLSWGTLHVASTILSQRAGSGTFCRVCL